MRTLFIEDIPGSFRAGIADDGILTDFVISSEGVSKSVFPRRGSVYRGKVIRVIPGIAAFVDIGDSRAAYLEPGKKGFSKDVVPGGYIPVMVERERIGSKGCRLSLEPVIAGRYLVLDPGAGSNRVSRRITAAKRDLITEIADRVVDNHVNKYPGHFTIRTLATEIPDTELFDVLRTEADYLCGILGDLRNRARSSDRAGILYESPDAAECLVRDNYLDSITVSSKESFSRFSAVVDKYFHDFSSKPDLRLFDGGAQELLFDHCGLDVQVRNSFQRKCKLPSGGEVVIDEAEALTAVDVNSGSVISGSSDEEKAFLVNREAASVIPAQIRLRGIGGIIAVDFLNMRNDARRAEILNIFKTALKKDPLVSRVSAFSELGIVEISRMRSHNSNLMQHSEECPLCHGGGRVPDVDTTLGDISRELFRRSVSHHGYEQILLLKTGLMSFFQSECGRLFLNKLSSGLGITVVTREMSVGSREPWGIISGGKDGMSR